MNRCILVGRLTRDPEVTFSEKAQMTIARFTLAVDRISKREGEAEADFFNCVAFDLKAEFVEQYWHSGMRVAVCGRMQNENYTNKKGEKVYGVSLKADDVEFADGKREPDAGQAQNTAPSHAAGTPSRTTAPSRSAASTAGRKTPKPASGGNAAQRPASRSAAGRTSPQRTARASASDGFMNVASGMEDDLPFN